MLLCHWQFHYAEGSRHKLPNTKNIVRKGKIFLTEDLFNNMKIYADILVLVNIYIDYFILLAVKRFLHLNPPVYRLIIAALVGGASGLMSLLPVPFWASWLLLAAAAFGICLIAFFQKNRLAYIKSVVCFFAFSLMFSGIVIVLVQLFQINATVIGGRVYFGISPALLIIFTVLAYVTSLLIEQIRGRKAPAATFCRVIIEGNGSAVELFTKIDTGSTLKEPFSDLPVIVAEKEAIKSILPPEALHFKTDNPAPGIGIRLIPYSSLGGTGLLPAFKPQRIRFKGSDTPLNCYVAVYEGRLSASGYSALMNPELFQ